MLKFLHSSNIAETVITLRELTFPNDSHSAFANTLSVDFYTCLEKMPPSKLPLLYTNQISTYVNIIALIRSPRYHALPGISYRRDELVAHSMTRNEEPFEENTDGKLREMC